MNHRRSVALAVLALATISTAAQAHGWHAGTASSFTAGFVHPFTGIDHLLAMLAVGLWSASAAPRPWLAPLIFAALLIAGALAAGGGIVPAPVLQGTEWAIAASVIVLGILVAWRIRLATPAVALVVGTFAFFHGAAHGLELGTAAAPLCGLAAATALLHGAGIALGIALRGRHQRLATLLGAAIAFAGIGLGAGLLAALA